MYEFLLCSPDDLLRNVRVYIRNDPNSSSSSHGLINGDSSIFPLCEQLFHEHQVPDQPPTSVEGKVFRFTFRTHNATTSKEILPHEIQMKTFVYLNYFHLQLIHIVGELNWSELIPCLSQTINLAERFDLATSNFGLRHIFQQLFAFEPPVVSFQHIKRVAFQYLVDYLMRGVKDELVRQSIESVTPQLGLVRDEERRVETEKIIFCLSRNTTN